VADLAKSRHAGKEKLIFKVRDKLWARLLFGLCAGGNWREERTDSAGIIGFGYGWLWGLLRERKAAMMTARGVGLI